MKRIFTKSIILDAANKQHKIVMEAIMIMLALTILSLGIAGFLTLLKKNFQSTTSAVIPIEQNKRSLLTYVFTNLQLSCSPVFQHSRPEMWSGICRSVNNKGETKTYSLSLKSKHSKNKYKGFKLAKEVFYIFTDKQEFLAGKHRALSVSTFVLGGGTFLKISGRGQKQSKNPNIYMVGLGLGLGFLIDKHMEIEFKDISTNLTAKK